MKKQSFLLTLVLLLYAWMASAQFTDQGNFLIGSTIGLSAADSKVSHSTLADNEGEGPSSLQFNIAPKAGYFVINDLVTGIGLDFTMNRVKEPNEDKIDDSNVLFGPFARYYFPAGNDIAFFGEVNFGFGNSSDVQTIGENRQSIKSNIFAVGVGPGVTIISGGGVGLEAIFKYNFSRSKFDTVMGGETNTTITRTNQFDISIGVQFYFESIRRARGG